MQAKELQAAWRAGNTSAAEQPHSLALLRHPARAAVARAFESAAGCLLARLSGAAAAAAAAQQSGGGAAAAALAWPQFLSYDSPVFMPTGRESSLPGALLRGLYVANTNGSVLVDLFDPRAPLETLEVQDSLPELYRCARAAALRCCLGLQAGPLL